MATKPTQLRRTTIRIAGMHCRSCELLLEERLKNIDGVVHVDVDYRSAQCTIVAASDFLPDEGDLRAVIEDAGYRMPGDTAAVPSGNSWIGICGALVVVLAFWKLLGALDIVSLAPSTSGALTLGSTFLIGLVAGMSSCLAVTGGLLLSMAATYNEKKTSEILVVKPLRSFSNRFTPLLSFNVGRLVSYFVLGGLIGLLGTVITLSTRMTGYVNIVVAFVMLYLGLTILGIVKPGSCPIRPPKSWSRWIAGLSSSSHPVAPFALGALTFFLPCGFTQSLQFVALSSGSPLQGALIMFVFALGTLPALLGLSIISATARGAFSRIFLRFAGALVLVLALANMKSGLVLTGIRLPSMRLERTTAAAPVARGNVQEIFMKVTPSRYEPSELTVRAGVPVRWTIDGTDARGCTSVLTIPRLEIVQPLLTGTNIVEFTPPREPGQLAFSCSMGMVTGTLTVIP